MVSNQFMFINTRNHHFEQVFQHYKMDLILIMDLKSTMKQKRFGRKTKATSLKATQKTTTPKAKGQRQTQTVPTQMRRIVAT